MSGSADIYCPGPRMQCSTRIGPMSDPSRTVEHVGFSSRSLPRPSSDRAGYASRSAFARAAGVRSPARLAGPAVPDPGPGPGGCAVRVFPGGTPDRVLMCGPAPSLPRRHLLFPSWRSRVRTSKFLPAPLCLSGHGQGLRAGPSATRSTCRAIHRCRCLALTRAAEVPGRMTFRLLRGSLKGRA